MFIDSDFLDFQTLDIEQFILQMSQHVSTDFALQSPIGMTLDTHRPDCGTASGASCLTILSPKYTSYISLNPMETELMMKRKIQHRHNYYELLYVIDGTVYQNIENTRHFYPVGSFCLMNTNIRHLEEYDGYARVLFLQFTQEYIKELLHFPSLFDVGNSLSSKHASGYEQMADFFYQDLVMEQSGSRSYLDFIPADPASSISGTLYQKLNTIASEMQKKTPSSSLKIGASVVDILCTLFNEEYFVNTPVNLGNATEHNRFVEVSNYIKERNGCVRRRELEHVFHYSGDYLYKLIRKYTGLSLYDYSVQITLEKACDLLRTTSLSVTTIMEELGFTNRTHFYKVFQDTYGMTPAAYRKQHRDPSE